MRKVGLDGRTRNGKARHLQGSMSRNVRQGSGCQDPFLLAGAVAQLPRGNATSTVVSDSPLTLFLWVARGSGQRQQPGRAWLADRVG